jgi:hypothetical protein
MRFVVCSLFCFSSWAFAQSWVEAFPQKSHDGDGYEIVIDGDVAKKIFLLLEVPASEVETSDGKWLNKKADRILCGQNQKTKTYSCSVSADRTGIPE